MKRRVFYVDVVRAIACVLVVVSHVFAPICSGMNNYPRPVWLLFNLFDSIIRPSAALYIMISGKIFLGSIREQSYVQFVWNRYSKILLPFFFWSLIYAFYESHVGATPFVFGRAVMQFLRGPTEYHLWFMYVILGLYLAMPLMRRFVRSASSGGLASFLILWTGFLLFQFLFPQYALGGLAAQLLSYGGYAVLGYVLDKTNAYHKKAGWCMLLWLAIVLFNAAGTYILTIQDGGLINEKLYFGAAPLVALQAAVMFLLLKNVGEESVLFRLSWLRAAITRLGRHSYNIYLNHALLIGFFANGALGFAISHNSGPNLYIGVSLTSAAVLASSLGLSVLLQNIPILSKLFVISASSPDIKPAEVSPSPPFRNAFPQTSRI